MRKNLNIVVVGMGPVGGVVATNLKKLGYNPLCVCNSPEYALQIQTKGFKQTGILGESQMVMNTIANIDELDAPVDIAFVATQAYDMPEACRQLLPFLKSSSAVVSLQKGICIDELTAIVGNERSIFTVLGIEVVPVNTGEAKVIRKSKSIIGMLKGYKNSYLDETRQILNNISQTIISNNIYEHLYSKLIINSCLNGLGAISGLNYGEILKNKLARKMLIELMREAIFASNAEGITVPPLTSMLDYYMFLEGTNFFHRIKRWFMLKVQSLGKRKDKSTALYNLEKGLITETEFLSGYISKLAAKNSVEVLYTNKLIKIIKEIENKERAINFQNIVDLNKD